MAGRGDSNWLITCNCLYHCLCAPSRNAISSMLGAFRITESLMLENTSKIIRSNRHPNPTMLRVGSKAFGTGSLLGDKNLAQTQRASANSVKSVVKLYGLVFLEHVACVCFHFPACSVPCPLPYSVDVSAKYFPEQK